MASAMRPDRVYAAPKAAAIEGDQTPGVRVLGDAHGAFEQGEGSGQVALAESQHADPVIGPYEAPRVSNCLGNLEPFFPEGPALGEHAQLGMAPARGHGRARRAG